MTKEKKRKAGAEAGDAPTEGLKPERVQARAGSDPVTLTLKLADVDRPTEGGEVELDLREPAEVRGLLVRPNGRQEPTTVRIDALRLRVPVAALRTRGGAGERKDR